MNDSSDKPPLPTGLQLTGIDPAFRENPHVVLDRLRSEAPVYYDPTLNLLYFLRHADARAMLADRTISRDPRKAPPDSLVRLRAPPKVIAGEFAGEHHVDGRSRTPPAACADRQGVLLALDR